MTQTEKRTLDGIEFEALKFEFPHASLLAIRAKNGVLGCGYISLATAEKMNDPVAIVTGVKTFDDMLAATVKSVSSSAAALGVEPGMTGRAALLKMS